jgi:hypothetical protein
MERYGLMQKFAVLCKFLLNSASQKKGRDVRPFR